MCPHTAQENRGMHIKLQYMEHRYQITMCCVQHVAWGKCCSAISYPTALQHTVRIVVTFILHYLMFVLCPFSKAADGVHYKAQLKSYIRGAVRSQNAELRPTPSLQSNKLNVFPKQKPATKALLNLNAIHAVYNDHNTQCDKKNS